MKNIRGNLSALTRSGRFDVIIYGCSCRHAMGADIAKQIKDSFPRTWAADPAAPTGTEKPGQVSTAETGCGGHHLTVVDAYTQDDWQRGGVLLGYGTLHRAMYEVERRFSGKHIVYPKIGTGLARGGWSKTAAIIDEGLASETHTLIKYDGTDTEAV